MLASATVALHTLVESAVTAAVVAAAPTFVAQVQAPPVAAGAVNPVPAQVTHLSAPYPMQVAQEAWHFMDTPATT